MLGAASSLDFGLPLGRGLKQLIAQALQVELNSIGEWKTTSPEQRQLLAALENNFKEKLNRADIERLLRKISDGVGLTSSIDNFLGMRRREEDLTLCAKATIASIILQREHARQDLVRRRSWREPTPNFDSTWHQIFAEICFEDVTEDGIVDALRRLTVISFNYDRTFEQFVRISIMQLYSLDAGKADELAQHIPVLHPYGCVAALPGTPSSVCLPFGDPVPRNIVPFAEQIKIFTENTRDESTVEAIRQVTGKADRIVFLGFGFHKQNLDILTPHRRSPGPYAQFIGTSVGLSPAGRTEVTQQLKQVFKGPHVSAEGELHDLKCREFLEQYRHTLLDKS